MTTPLMLFSFDVAVKDMGTVKSWHNMRHYFQEMGVKATFFVGGWRNLSQQAKDMLKELESMGHEIGAHSETHTPATDYKKFSYGEYWWLDNYLNNEVLNPKSQMESEGFYPVSWAYPSCYRDDKTDFALKKHYKWTRGCLDKPYVVPHKELRPPMVVGTLFMDNMSENGYWPMIKGNIDMAVQAGSAFFLAAHHVGDDLPMNQTLRVSIADLQMITEYAKDKGMKFVRYKDLENLDKVLAPTLPEQKYVEINVPEGLKVKVNGIEV